MHRYLLVHDRAQATEPIAQLLAVAEAPWPMTFANVICQIPLIGQQQGPGYLTDENVEVWVECKMLTETSRG